jgi:hypothetical protein
MTPKQEQALRDYLKEAIVPLIEQVLVKKLGQAMEFTVDQKLLSPRRKWIEITKGEIDSWDLPDKPTLAELVWFIESKIKEKNYDAAD